MATETYVQDNLIAGDNCKLVTDSVTIGTAADLDRGSVLGEITLGAVPATGTADGSNTGNGTVTVVTASKNAQIGVYTIICVEAVTNGGIFQVKDPNGRLISEVTIPAGAGATVDFVNDEINGTITDGSTDFALGDFFTVTTIAGSGKYVLVLSTAVDGSQNPVAILAEDAAAAAADVDNAAIYVAGEFNTAKLVFGGSDTAAQHKKAMRILNMYQKDTVALD